MTVTADQLNAELTKPTKVLGISNQSELKQAKVFKILGPDSNSLIDQAISENFDKQVLVNHSHSHNHSQLTSKESLGSSSVVVASPSHQSMQPPPRNIRSLSATLASFIVEQSSEDIWRACGHAVRAALSAANVSPEAIAGKF